jgi:hypothetical protein
MKSAWIAAALLAALATPVMAQPVIENPGKCAQFYPNANCQNYGPGNPYTNGISPHRWRSGHASMGYPHRRWHHRHVH